MEIVRRERAPDMALTGLLILLALASLMSLGRMATKATQPDGGLDFHSYWYAGHFVRRKQDPYQAYLTGASPETPVYYLDGRKSGAEIAQPGLPRTPANTAAYVLPLSLLAFFSWQNAKIIWVAFNFLLLLAIPWLVVKLLPDDSRLPVKYQLLIALSFYSFQSARVAVWIGQTTLLTFALMLGTLLTMRRHRLLAGVMLGFALSKYSLSLPIFLFVILSRQYWTALISLGVQAVGMALVTAVFHTSPWAQLTHYLAILLRHRRLPSIHVGYLLPEKMDAAFSLVLTLLVFGALAYWYKRVNGRPRSLPAASRGFAFWQFHIITILCLWPLLVVYHRIYDVSLAVLFLALLVYGLRQQQWRLAPYQRKLLWLVLLAAIGILVLPGTVAGRFLSDEYARMWLLFVDRVTTFLVVGMVGLSCWLLFKLPFTATAVSPAIAPR